MLVRLKEIGSPDSHKFKGYSALGSKFRAERCKPWLLVKQPTPTALGKPRVAKTARGFLFRTKFTKDTKEAFLTGKGPSANSFLGALGGLCARNFPPV